ncbi:MAG: DNA polymerase III subunit delta [Oscillospiraceae bacterium]|nr:DNA polymerase III subunit delta [Oscillospiraceae bacterium]
MAKKTFDRKKETAKLDYKAEIRRLDQDGLQRLYLLWGPEDYLLDCFLDELKKRSFPDGEDSFSYRRLDGPFMDPYELQDAIDALPFLTERSFVEVRDVDVNALGAEEDEGQSKSKKNDPVEQVLKVLSDIPGHCTVVFTFGPEYKPDGRLKAVKGLRKLATEIVFTQQDQKPLEKWMRQHFSAAGKKIGDDALERLRFVSGELMSRLLPEIEKVASYAKGDTVTVADVDAVAHHIPEAYVFDMTEQIATRRFDQALGTLSELLADRSTQPIFLVALLGNQMKRLYAARLAIDQRLGTAYVTKVLGCTNYAADMTMRSARGYSLRQLKRAMELCVETDHRCKSSGEDADELLKQLVLDIIMVATDAES